MDASALAQFKDLTGASDAVARQFLTGSDLETAVASYFAAQEAGGGGAAGSDGAAAGADQADVYEPTDEEKMNRGMMGDGAVSGASTVAGGSGSGGARASSASRNSRFATLGSVRADEEDDEDLSLEERRKRQELYAGGGRSGLAIQNPDDQTAGHEDLISNILKQAAEGSAARGEADADAGAGPSARQPKARSSAFTGSGMTLGSDEAPSVAVPARGGSGSGAAKRGGAGPTAGAVRQAGLLGMLGNMAGFGGVRRNGDEDEDDDEGDAMDDEDDEDEDASGPQIRELTFWRNGFSIGDGPLMSQSDPRHNQILQAILAGTAPVDLLGLKVGQPVEVRVAKRTDEDWVAPPKVSRPFEGAGNRLGSPAPEVRGQAQPAAPTTGPAVMSATPAFEVDPSQPTTTVQVRLADGTKLTARLNLTHTVGDIRGFIRAAQPTDRAFLVQTTFPNKVLADDAQTVEQAGLKNAVVVQRWA